MKSISKYKTLFILFLSFAYCICKGQKTGLQGLPDSVLEILSHTVSGKNLDSVFPNGVSIAVAGSPYGTISDSSMIKIPDNDTVKVVMLLSDTTEPCDGCISVSNPLIGVAIAWRYGFKVYDYKNEEILYLDEQKKRLPKTVVVWQDVEK